MSPQRTDYGTVFLHWLLVAALLTSIITGLGLAADAPQMTWLRPFEFILPRDNVWQLHFASGLLLAGVTVAYVVYLWRARLSRRISLDRMRLSGLLRRGRGRWGAINVVLHWVFFLAFLAQLATGALTYLGYGGSVVTLHLQGALALAVYPLVHVVAQWVYGGVDQVMRILRPTRQEPPAPPPSLAEVLAEQLARQDGQQRARDLPDGTNVSTAHVNGSGHVPHATRLQANPLAVAIAAGAVATGLVVLTDTGTRDVLVIEAVPAERVPKLDGDLGDPAWRAAVPVVVHTNQGANFDGTGATRVEIRAVHDTAFVYFAFVWDDPTRSLKHLPLIKRFDGWRLLHERYDVEDEDAFHEDKFAVLLSRRSEMPGAGSAHLGAKPLDGKPGGLSGRGLHYTASGGIVDMWHWKAANGGLLGYMDDNYVGSPAEPTPAEREGKSRYKGGFASDPGKASYANNFKSEPPGGYRGAIQPIRLPKDLGKTVSAMGRIDLDTRQSETDGARWWMTIEESVPYAATLDARIPVGTVIPGVLISGEYVGDRADLRCAARWAAGRWTLEVARRLNTGSPHDVPIASGVFMWVAAFDHSQTRHTRHMRPIRLEVR